MIRKDQLVEWVPIALGIAFLLAPFGRSWSEAPAVNEIVKLSPGAHIARDFFTRASFRHEILLVFKRPENVSAKLFSCELATPIGPDSDSCTDIQPRLTASWKVFEGPHVVASGDGSQIGLAVSNPTDVFELLIGDFDARRWTNYHLKLDIRVDKRLSASSPRLQITVHPLYWKGDGLFFIVEWALGIPLLVAGISLMRRNRRRLPPPVRRFGSDVA